MGDMLLILAPIGVFGVGEFNRGWSETNFTYTLHRVLNW